MQFHAFLTESLSYSFSIFLIYQYRSVVIIVTLHGQKSHILRLATFVHCRYHRMFSKYMRQGNKTEIKCEDMEKAVETVMKNEKKLR